MRLHTKPTWEVIMGTERYQGWRIHQPFTNAPDCMLTVHQRGDHVTLAIRDGVAIDTTTIPMQSNPRRISNDTPEGWVDE